jgi:hypothetical protein
MLQAMVHGKLTREEEGMEDLLTSNAFGLMKYLPPESAVFPFLSLAKDPLSGTTLHDWLKDAIQVKEWYFWRHLHAPGCISCEPDVELFILNRDDTITWLLIEAKYHSGKSSPALEGESRPNDQLAREFDNLQKLCKKEGISRYGVIYLTADFSCPVEDVYDSVKEYEIKKNFKPKIYWLSWRRLPDILESNEAQPIARDLNHLFLKLDLIRFRRLRFADLGNITWSFKSKSRSWRWENIEGNKIDWHFGSK